MLIILKTKQAFFFSEQLIYITVFGLFWIQAAMAGSACTLSLRAKSLGYLSARSGLQDRSVVLHTSQQKSAHVT